jgi:DNA polymerase I-like protein with 3'-5' exonuclease and polymerase domains
VSYCTFDIETGTVSRFKRKGTPFGGLNDIVMVGWRRKGMLAKAVESIYRGKGTGGANRTDPGWLRKVVGDAKLLVGFNIKFDLLHALQEPENLAFWMQWVADGGNVWDCQLAEYLLEGMVQESHMLSLDDVAPRYGGNTKFDEVKALWNAGVATEDIEPSILKRYLCGQEVAGQWEKGDVENTEAIFLGQLKRAREAGQVRSILLNMGALLFTVEAERNGMFVDVPLGREQAAALAARIAQHKADLHQYLPKDLPFEFSWSSRRQLSALIFGGTVPFDRREYQIGAGEFTFDSAHPDQVYAQKDETRWVVGDDGQQISYGGIAEGPPPDNVVRFKGGKRAGEPKTTKIKVPDLTKPKSRMGTGYFKFPGYTAPSKAWETADPGVYSTATEVIEELANRNVPFLKALAQMHAMAKDLGTYYVTTDSEGVEKGMLTLVGEDGIVHHQLNMCSTVTARLSSSSPNLQNIPKGNKSEVKSLFRSRFEGGSVIQSDFSSLEVYIQAILTGSKQLIADLKAGLDLHCVRLAAKEGMQYEEVLRLAKGYTDAMGNVHEAVSEWDYKRTGAKVYSFQRAYGAGAAKIASSTGMPLEDVERLSAAEDERYPEIPAYYESITMQIKQNRRPTNRFVPHPVVRGVMCQLGRSFMRTPDGKLYSFQESPSPEFLVKRGTNASFSPTEIRNYPVQGGGGEWAKAAMWLSVREFYRRKNWGGLGLLVNQVHDAEYADAHPSVRDEVAAVLHACMEAASDFMEFYFDWPVPVPVPSDTTAGASMMDDKPLPGIRPQAATIRQELRARYMDGYVPSFDKGTTNG